MKNYLLSPEGLKRIDGKDLERWRLQGGFMRSEGPVLSPIALGRPEADVIESLLARDENFVFWFTPDFRVVLSGKAGPRGKIWKVRFELRGMTQGGKAGVQTLLVQGKFETSKIIHVIAEVFTKNRQSRGATAPAITDFAKIVEDAKDMNAEHEGRAPRSERDEGMSPERRALAREAAASAAAREAELLAMTPENRERAIAEWASKLAGDVADLTD